MANLREAQKELTRTRLLATALDLFQSQGYSATTVDDIAATAGTTRPTFYAHFPSRRDVMRALIDELNEKLERSESESHGSTASRLVEAVRAGTAAEIGPWVREQAARWPTIKPYILSATHASAVDEEIRELYQEWFEEVIGDIEEGLQLAGRYAPATHRIRGKLAVALLDSMALDWMRHTWDIERVPALDVLIEAWVKLLGEPA